MLRPRFWRGGFPRNGRPTISGIGSGNGTKSPAVLPKQPQLGGQFPGCPEYRPDFGSVVPPATGITPPPGEKELTPWAPVGRYEGGIPMTTVMMPEPPPDEAGQPILSPSQLKALAQMAQALEAVNR